MFNVRVRVCVCLTDWTRGPTVHHSGWRCVSSILQCSSASSLNGHIHTHTHTSLVQQHRLVNTPHYIKLINALEAINNSGSPSIHQPPRSRCWFGCCSGPGTVLRRTEAGQAVLRVCLHLLLLLLLLATTGGRWRRKEGGERTRLHLDAAATTGLLHRAGDAGDTLSVCRRLRLRLIIIIKNHNKRGCARPQQHLHGARMQPANHHPSISTDTAH